MSYVFTPARKAVVVLAAAAASIALAMHGAPSASHADAAASLHSGGSHSSSVTWN